VLSNPKKNIPIIFFWGERKMGYANENRASGAFAQFVQACTLDDFRLDLFKNVKMSVVSLFNLSDQR
jgi:hypothetical protein